MNTAKAQFALRLREAMVAEGYAPRPAVLEREFNTRHFGKSMTLHGVRRWLLGQTMPSQDKLLTLSRWLRVPPEDLAFGSEPRRALEARQASWDQGIGYADRHIFELYLKLPVPARKTARDVIAALAVAHQVEGA
ncbi:XRE family transcriptional regulator [Leptothrix discophora]|uniref:XRE family transcriptional regulator n=1 Tax=Leptothrix discophora TaxID=89 RepID=A0ABT9FYT9_LEPDI|nr:XRE family transcriptional regulator [Leptothrix discophora]MDP4299306.1 XRE family transcriptional regulator [Leptothrix discophora]